MDKISGSGSGSGRVGVSKYTIGYFRVCQVFSGISGYVGYFRVFPDMSGICGYFQVYKYRIIPETPGLPEISGNTRYFRLPATQ